MKTKNDQIADLRISLERSRALCNETLKRWRDACGKTIIEDGTWRIVDDGLGPSLYHAPTDARYGALPLGDVLCVDGLRMRERPA